MADNHPITLSSLTPAGASVFWLYWVITFDTGAAASLRVEPQHLLAGDPPA